ncbi:hypothetical protein [Photorhabdus laumondii]|uniref:hypothetical protein n=1 Tax=Photorhabdus laumondii TaxID=2218628 RepID=UPI003314A361
MYKNMLNPVTLRKTANGPQLKGNEGTYDTSILKGSPVGRRDIGNSAPLPAQAEVFQKVVDEKIANFKTKGNLISIVVWHNSRTGLTHIMDGQHRFIAACILGVPVNLTWKKFGIPPNQIDWGGTKFSDGIPAKTKIFGK